MKVTVIGAGYVGLVTAACLAAVGNSVMVLELDVAKVRRLAGGEVPLYEPGLAEIMQRSREEGRLHFTADAALATAFGDVQFIAVGTPPSADGSADISQVLAAAQTIGRHMQGFKLVVNKSTVPVGTGERVRALIEGEMVLRGLGGQCFTVASNPEFLKEGAAVDDFMRPERIVVGTEPGPLGGRGLNMLRQLYQPFNGHQERLLHMDVKAAEFTKYAANAMLATRISFINELANLAGHVGVDIEQVRKGIGSDSRIGSSFLYAGTGYGGSCFPKDVRALIHVAAQHGQQLRVLEAVDAVNEAQKAVLVGMVCARFGGDDLKGRVFTIWGLSFKPDTDDMREAPSLVIVRALLERGAQLILHDPVAMEEARRALVRDLGARSAMLDQVRFADSAIAAADGADALLIVTEWAAFRTTCLGALKASLRSPVIFDGRNVYDPVIRQHGFEYYAIGR